MLMATYFQNTTFSRFGMTPLYFMHQTSTNARVRQNKQKITQKEQKRRGNQ